jgi:hypothetical protein
VRVSIIVQAETSIRKCEEWTATLTLKYNTKANAGSQMMIWAVGKMNGVEEEDWCLLSRVPEPLRTPSCLSLEQGQTK